MAWTDLSRRKSIADILASGTGDGLRLSRTLGPASIVALGVGAIIGAGIFVLTGAAAAEYAGPAVTLSFLIAGIACAFVGLCYAELASMIPVSGSTYTYTYATLGEFFAWIIGWDLVLEYALGAATVSVGWSGYFASLLRDLGIYIPPELTAAPGVEVKMPDGSVVEGVVNLPAAAIVLILSALLIAGTRQTSLINNIMVVVKLIVVVSFIALGVAYVNVDNWSPFIPENTGTYGEYGWSGVLRGASVVFFAYIGFDAIATAAQEARNPQRDMPIGVIGSLIVCTTLYIAVAAVLTGVVPYAELGVPDPIALGVNAMHMPGFAIVIKIGALAGLTTVVLVLLYAQSRIFYTMSRDRLLPAMFSDIHRRRNTPWRSQSLIGVLVAIVAALTPIGVLGEMVSIGTLFAFLLVCGAVLYLRKAEPEIERPFRAPWSPVVPVIGIAMCLLLMLSLPLDTWLRLIVWLVIGLTIYFLYSRPRAARHRMAG